MTYYLVLEKNLFEIQIFNSESKQEFCFLIGLDGSNNLVFLLIDCLDLDAITLFLALDSNFKLKSSRNCFY